MGQRSRAARSVVLLVLVVGGLMALAAPAAAHPLGNFTVNRYARIEVSAGVVQVLYVLDLAEIPAFQERQEVDADPEGYARDRAGEIARNLELVVGARPVPLRLADQRLEQPPGQGGLDTLRLSALLVADVEGLRPEQAVEATFTDTNQPDRLGWREIVVRAAADAEILRSDAPEEDLTDALRRYPEDRISSPLDLRRVSWSYTEGDVRARPPNLDDTAAGAVTSVDGFAALVTRTDLSVAAFAGLLALALGFGAVHAVGPGHGKTIMAAYLVSTRGRPRDAVLLGGIVSVMHTASVLVLGGVLLVVDRSVAAETAYPVLTLISGMAVTGVGAWLLASRWRQVHPQTPFSARSRPEKGSETRREHDHGGHGHDHDHDHDHDEHGHHHGPGGHSHALPDDVAPLSRRGLVALGTSGGLFPSPSAVLVMVGAVGLGRAGLGLALLAAFSIGLAATLTVVGLGLVYGRSVLERRGFARRFRYAPVIGAGALILLGVVIVGRGLAELA